MSAIETSRVTFESGGLSFVGDLVSPAGETSKLPAVAIIGPMTFERNQAPSRYAQTLAENGFRALAFDPRYRGDSGGEPRAWENPVHKVEDLKEAVSFLANRDDVNADRVHVLGICQGGSEALRAAAEHPAARSLTTITSQYRDKEGDLAWLTEEGYEARLARGVEAFHKYRDTGEVDYVKAVDQTDMEVGMPGDFVWEWYQPWADRGEWENRYAVMSDKDLLEYESISAAQTIGKPWLMIHGDQCFLPDAAKRHFDAIPEGTPKRLVWDDTPHLAYYDQADAIARGTAETVAWFERH
ncbi:alpha/beta hydrolase [Parvularcula maris]|uniref:Alpha/beta hydrolase n=1 Tax=Parvularcula maris TaxID=2965077 RepID=A0A9X2RLA1_9PROT|nr:alpha/beta fold hydrolase [Parvularcula maris]MCQ8186618.1 alpha/beta hydrolase [Parvularcula maris]